MNITTIKQNSEYTEIINKSKFIAYSFCLQNLEQIDDFLQNLRQKHSDATHICYAYKFFGSEKAVDDGEPQGTAGRPILEAIKKQNISNVFVAIVRYFGGIKLGAGGLTRAYGNIAQKVILISGTKQLFECKRVQFCLPITDNKKLAFISNLQELCDTKIDYGENINILLFCKAEQTEEAVKKIQDIFAKKIDFQIDEQTILI